MRFTVKESTQLRDFLLVAMHGISKTSVKQMLANGLVHVNGKAAYKYDLPLNAGMSVEILKEQQRKISLGGLIDIVYEDEYILIVNKKEGLLSVSTNSNTPELTAHSILNDYVKQNPEYIKKNSYAESARVYIVHRLDRETSGLMVFAKDEHSKNTLQENWSEYILSRKYVAIVEGEVEKDRGRIVSWLTDSKAFITYSSKTNNGGKKAITDYVVLDRIDGYSLLELELETGRKNQIRVHMQDIGHPIVGDLKYGGIKSNRLHLHAHKLSMLHPITEKELNFTSKIPFRL